MLFWREPRERVLSHDEEARYLDAAAQFAQHLEGRYQQSLHGLRAMPCGGANQARRFISAPGRRSRPHRLRFASESRIGQV